MVIPYLLGRRDREAELARQERLRSGFLRGHVLLRDDPGGRSGGVGAGAVVLLWVDFYFLPSPGGPAVPLPDLRCGSTARSQRRPGSSQQRGERAVLPVIQLREQVLM